MTAEICRIDKYGQEVKNRDLLSGRTMRGWGRFSKSKTPVRVQVVSLETGEGIDVSRIDVHKQLDESVKDHYSAGDPSYTLTKWWQKRQTVFRLYPH